MLSIGYPKINFQATNENAYPQLLSHIDKVLTPLKEGGKREVEENQGSSAYQVNIIFNFLDRFVRSLI